MIVTLALIQLCDFLHLFLRQGEIEDIQIVPDVVHVLAAGDDREAHLRVPAEDHLRGRLIILFAERGKDRFFDQGPVAVAQRIPAHQFDAVLIKRFAELLLCEIGVRFHLNKLGDDLPFCFQFRDIFAFKVMCSIVIYPPL